MTVDDGTFKIVKNGKELELVPLKFERKIDGRRNVLIHNVQCVIENFDTRDYALIQYSSSDIVFVNEKGEEISEHYASAQNLSEHGYEMYIVTKYDKIAERTYYGMIDYNLECILKVDYDAVKILPIGICFYKNDANHYGPDAVVYGDGVWFY